LILPTCGVNLETEILDDILYVVGNIDIPL